MTCCCAAPASASLLPGGGVKHNGYASGKRGSLGASLGNALGTQRNYLDPSGAGTTARPSDPAGDEKR